MSIMDVKAMAWWNQERDWRASGPIDGFRAGWLVAVAACAEIADRHIVGFGTAEEWARSSVLIAEEIRNLSEQ